MCALSEIGFPMVRGDEALAFPCRTYGRSLVMHADCFHWLRQVPENSIDAAVLNALGMAAAVQHHPRSVVVIGSAPTVLLRLLTLGSQGRLAPPVLVVGMPVGFVGVREAKAALARSGWPHVRLEGSRGGDGLAAAVVNALLRRAWLDGGH